MIERDFTILNDPLVNEKIRHDLDHIQETLLREFSGIRSMILAGGFGRGEGGVVRDNGQIIPVNDYDIVLVVSKKLDRDKLDRIRKRLAKELGIWWVDISAYSLAQIKRLPYSMYSHDLKYGGHVFWGDETALDHVPEMGLTRMPLKEGELLFFTRIWCFLGSFKQDFYHQEMTGDEKFLMMNQISKAVCACIDANLILQGLYHVSYQERLRRFVELKKQDTRYIKLATVATEFKLRPYKELDQDILDLYFEIKEIFLQEMFAFVSCMYQKKFKNWNEYLKTYFIKFEHLCKACAYFLLGRGSLFVSRLRVNSAQLLLLSSYDRSGVNAERFSEAKEMLRKVIHKDPDRLTWDEFRKIVVKLRNKI